MGHTVTVTVSSNVSKAKSALPDAVKRALEICGGKAETYAKQLCPVDTGNLRNSITHYAEGTNAAVIGSAVEYAPYVELGHHTKSGSFVSPQPYLAPAIENHVNEYIKIIESELKKG